MCLAHSQSTIQLLLVYVAPHHKCTPFASHCDILHTLPVAVHYNKDVGSPIMPRKRNSFVRNSMSSTPPSRFVAFRGNQLASLEAYVAWVAMWESIYIDFFSSPFMQEWGHSLA